MKVTKTIINVALVWLSIISIFFIGCYAYYMITDSGLYRHGTETYVASYKDPQTGEDVNPFSLNYYQNYNNTGKEVLEWRINGYSGADMSGIYGRGYQLIIDKENGNELYYCDTYNGVSWESMHDYDELNKEEQYKNFYYISIDGELYAIRIDGTYTVNEEYLNGWKVARTVIFCGWNLLFENTDYYEDNFKTYHYTIEDIMLKFASMIKSNSYGTGEFTLPVVDLGDYIHVYDIKDGEVSDEPIGDGGQINSYFSIDVNYDKRGMTYADQSMFGSVAGDSDFNITGIDFDVNYWKSTFVYNLDETDFIARYSSVDLGYYYSLSADTISELKKHKNLEIHVTFNVDSFKNINVLGFDYYALNGLDIDSLTISSSNQRDFTLLVGALKDTGIETINTENINIVNLSGSEVA